MLIRKKSHLALGQHSRAGGVAGFYRDNGFTAEIQRAAQLLEGIHANTRPKPEIDSEQGKSFE